MLEDSGKDAFLLGSRSSGSFTSLARGCGAFESGPVQVYQEFRTAAIGADVLLIDIYITDPLWC